MPVFKDDVIVIKSINYGEADKILTVVGKNFGKFPLIAKGIRKIESKNRGNIQTLSASKISFYRNQGMGVLMESKNIFSPDYSISNLKGIERVLTLLNKCVEEGPESCEYYPKLYSVLKHDFREDYVNKFRLVFLKSMGLMPYRSCSKCGSNDCIEYLDMESFEIFCEKCYLEEKQSEICKFVKTCDINYVCKNFTNCIDLYIQKVLY